MGVLNTKSKYTNKTNMFLSDDMGIQRFDVLKYKQFDKLTEKQLVFIWRPEEVEILKDAKDFKD